MANTNEQMEERITEFIKANNIVKEEAGILKTAINVLEKEKNILRLTVGDKTEKLAQLRSDLVLKVLKNHTYS